MNSPTTPEPTVHIVEDDAAVRESLLLLLQVKGIAAAGFAGADEFLAAVRPDSAGCLLLDLRMPGTGGLELQAALRERGIGLPVVIITAHGDVAAARRAFIAGAVDFLEKPLEEAALLAAVAIALERDQVRRAADSADASRGARIARLSRREREVMWLAGAGKQNRDIAAALALSPRTVEIYKARMLEKLQIRGLPELLVFLKGARRDGDA